MVLLGDDLAIVMHALCVISNSTAIAEVFSRIAHKYDLTSTKGAFLHWRVGEAMVVSNAVLHMDLLLYRYTLAKLFVLPS